VMSILSRLVFLALPAAERDKAGTNQPVSLMVSPTVSAPSLTPLPVDPFKNEPSEYLKRKMSFWLLDGLLAMRWGIQEIKVLSFREQPCFARPETIIASLTTTKSTTMCRPKLRLKVLSECAN
jgi:hypothetical protein